MKITLRGVLMKRLRLFVFLLCVGFGTSLSAQSLSECVIEDGSFVDGYWRLWEWGQNTRGEMTGEAITNEDGKKSKALCMEYEVYKEGVGILIMSYLNPIPIPGNLRKLSLDVKGNGTSHGLQVIVRDKNNEMFTFDLCDLRNAGWSTYDLAIPERKDNKKIVFPVKFYGLQVHTYADQKFVGKQKVFVRNVKAFTELGSKDPFAVVGVYFKEPTGFFVPGTPFDIYPRLYIYKPVGLDYDLEVDFRDVRGLDLFSKKIPLKKVNGLVTLKVSLPQKKLGPWLGEIRLMEKKTLLAKRDVQVALTPENLAKGLDPDSPFGMTMSSWEPFEKICERVGVKHMRTFAWSPAGWNPKKGEYVWQQGGTQKNYDDQVDKALKHGMYIMPIFSDVPNWLATPESKGWDRCRLPVSYEDFQQVCKDFAAHYKGKMIYAEPYNEPTLQMERFGGVQQSFYTLEKVASTFAKGISSGDPNMISANHGQTGFVPDYYAKLGRLGMGKDWKVINGHFYCFSPDVRQYSPERNRELVKNYSGNVNENGEILFLDRLRDSVRVRDRYFPGYEIFLTEIGWDDTAGQYPVGKYLQAAYLVRAYIWGMVEGIDKTFWFYLLDDTAKPVYNHYFDSMGLFNRRYEPQPCASAFNVMVNMLSKSRYIGDVRNLLVDNSDVYAHLFENKDGQPLLCVFADLQRGQTKMYMELPGTAKVQDMYGNLLTIQKNEIPLSDETIYITGLSWDDPLIAQGVYRENALRDWFTFQGNKEKFTVTIDGSHSKITLEGNLALELPEGYAVSPSAREKFSCAPGKILVKEFEITIPYSAKGKENPWSLLISDNRNVRKLFRKNFAISSPYNFIVQPVKGNLYSGSSVSASVIYTGNPDVDLVASVVNGPGLSVNPELVNTGIMRTEDSKEFTFTVKAEKSFNLDSLTNLALRVENKKGGFSKDLPLVPDQLKSPYVSTPIVLDGNLGEWNSSMKVPVKFVRDVGDVACKMYRGWNEKGLYFAFEVEDKKIESFPASFWEGDVVEVWVDMANSKNPGFVKGCHQFYITLPGGAGKDGQKALVGQWHREGDDLKASLPDVTAVQRGFRKTAEGYVLELFFPVEALHSGKLAEGMNVGLNMNVSYGEGFEAYWVTSKKGLVDFASPKNWGTLLLTK